jgi:hypothetical protein
MTKTKQAESPPKATFVFKGAIRKVRAATMRNLPVDERTAVVHVEQVLDAPPSLARYAGRNITVQLAPRGKAAVGQELIFHTAGWIFGDSVAVRAVKQEPVTRAGAARLARALDPTRERADREMRERVAAADLVVSGKVVAVKLPGESEPSARAARQTAPAISKPVSEHDPKWREAVVEVDEVHKGEHGTHRVSVLFPSSTDVRWYKAPKFTAGQQGFFVLHKTTMKEAEQVDTRARALATPPSDERDVEVYTALHPADVRPLTDEEHVRRAIARTPGATKAEKR